jgi:hypothetical protein
MDAAPESPYAWRAAANLIPAPDKTWPGAARHGFEWPYESWLPRDGAIPTDTRWRGTPAEARSVAENAVRWLLRMQRPDGSWNDCRYAYWDSPAITPNAWMAITALCASALTAWRELAPGEIDAALVRAEDYLCRSGRLNAGKNEKCYAHAYRIHYLVRTLAVREDATQRRDLLGRVQELVDQLLKIQGTGGMWAHEYDNAFCSAAVREALERAKRAGAAVPEAAVARGIDALAAARFEDGSFTYGGRLGKGAKPGVDSLKNSCGRMPGCEAALFAWGRSDLKSLAKRIERVARRRRSRVLRRARAARRAGSAHAAKPPADLARHAARGPSRLPGRRARALAGDRRARRIEERVVTLAGEGIELAVATDHNHQTDYRPLQEAMGLTRWYAPVVGNEVTTDNGRMNAFPLPPGKDVPAYKETDWAKLVDGVRAKGASVVILNHPRWPEKGKDPLTAFGFDVQRGERRASQPFTFDRLELVNSDAPTQPPDVVLPVWYALLNRGEVFTGAGASDSYAPVKFTFTRDGTTLYVQPGAQSAARLEATAQDRFEIEGAGVVFEFDAEMKQMTVRQRGGDRVFTKDD